MSADNRIPPPPRPLGRASEFLSSGEDVSRVTDRELLKRVANELFATQHALGLVARDCAEARSAATSASADGQAARAAATAALEAVHELRRLQFPHYVPPQSRDRLPSVQEIAEGVARGMVEASSAHRAQTSSTPPPLRSFDSWLGRAVRTGAFKFVVSVVCGAGLLAGGYLLRDCAAQVQTHK